MSTNVNLDKAPRAAINPYLNAVGFILSRLFWDLHPYSWASRKRIGMWKDKYRGQKAVIMCNGPSLNKVNFDELAASGVFTFGLNKINLLFNRTDLKPSVIVAVNPYVIEQNAEFYNSTHVPLFLDSVGRKWVKFHRNTIFLHSSGSAGKFARDCSISVNQGYTVTYVAMQLSFHMGFQEVALVGCDHTFTTKGAANKTVIANREDPNHFDPNYFPEGVKWQLPDLTASEWHYEIARDTFARNGRKIINCTEGGLLEVFETKKLYEFLNFKRV